MKFNESTSTQPHLPPDTLNGASALPDTWHRPQDAELSAEEAAQVRAQFNNLDRALKIAEVGLHVIPAEVRRYGDRWLKKPLIDGWRAKATTDAEQVRRWWKRFPHAVPGIELERSNLVVIDADRHGGPDGVLAFDNLVSAHGGSLPPHPSSLTPGNGQHHFFQQRQDKRLGNRRGSLPLGIDVRGAGGWIVAPGAVRSDGRRYEPAPGAPPLVDAYTNKAIPTVPIWFMAYALDMREPPASATQRPGASARSPSPSASTRETAYARKALEGAAQDLRVTPPGRRNEALNGAAYHMARMVAREWIDQTEVADVLSEAGIASGLDVDEVQRTLASGLGAGLQNPAEDLVDRPSARGNGSFGGAEIPWSESAKNPPKGSKTPNSPKTPTPEARHIRLVRGERARVTDEATAILRERGDIFERGGELVRIAADGIEPVADDWLLDYYDRHVEFIGSRRQGDDFVDEPRDAPQWLGRRITAKRGERGLRELRAVITAPTMRADGTLLAKPGYDLATGLLLVAASQRPLVPDRPSITELKAAAATLWRPFADFPFVDKTARSVMLAAILTAVIRQTLGLAPAFSFDAPTAGTGKSLLGFCLLAVCGMERQAIPDCRDEEEIRKRLLSTLRSGLPGVLFDNIRGQFGSAALEAMLTTEQYTGFWGSWGFTCLGSFFGSANLRQQRWKAWTMSGNTTDAISRLCIQCRTRPRLGTLSRCGDCVRAAAEADRQSRIAAETRVDARKRAQEEAEARADAILARDAQLLQDLGQHVEALQHCYQELLRPRNDPQYVATLEDHEKDRTQVANVTATVHHTVDGGRSWLSIGLTNPRDHARASEAARVLGRHLEAPVIRHEDPKDTTRLADRAQAQPAKHTFGREARSLGNRSTISRATAKRRGGGAA